MSTGPNSVCTESVSTEGTVLRVYGIINNKTGKILAAGRVCLMATLVFACREGACDELSGVELFIEACRHQGLNPVQIRSGFAEYEREIKNQPLSEREIQKRIEDDIELWRKHMASAVTDVGRRNVEQQIRDSPARIRSRNVGIERSRTRSLFRGNDVSDGYRRQETVQFDSVAQKWSDKPDVVLRRGLEDGADNVVWNPNRPWTK